MATHNLTAERLRALLDYNPNTGIFTWRVRRTIKAFPGSIAGYQSTIGYILISVDGVMHNAHRLAWLHFYGEWPKHQIDHIDQVRSNNRIANLRDVTCSLNLHNISAPRKDNKCGVRGVYFDHRRNNFVVQLSINGKRRFIKSYQTIEQARDAYIKEKRRRNL